MSIANIELLAEATGNAPIDFYVEAAANPIPPWRSRSEWPTPHARL